MAQETFTMSSQSLKNLVQESRQLTSHILPTSIAPIERGLDQIEASTKRLLRRTAASQKSAFEGEAQSPTHPALSATPDRFLFERLSNTL